MFETPLQAKIRQLINEGRRQADERHQEAIRRFGVEVDGVTYLPFTPEVQEFLGNKPEEPRK